MTKTQTTSQKIPKLRFPEFFGEWEEKKLGEVAEFFNSKRIPLTEGTRKKGIYPYYGASGIIDYVENYIFDGEYILLGEDGANIVMRNSRLVFLVKGKFWLNNHAHIFQAKGSNYFLCEVLEKINYTKYNTGTAQPKVNSEVVKSIKINLPQLPEQQKIASFLSSVDEKIESLKKKKELFEEYKKGVMQKIFKQEIRFKDENDRDFEEWEEKKLGEIGDFKTSSVDKKVVKGEKEVFLLNYMDVYKHKNINNVTKNDLMIVTAKENQIMTNNLKKGDILFTPSSETPDDIGHSIVIFEDLENTLYSYHLMRFRPKINLDILYSHYFCNIPSVLKQITQVATGSTRFTIGIGDFSKIKIFLPSLPEQEKIADFLSGIDEKIEKIGEEVEKVEEFKKGLLQEMFV